MGVIEGELTVWASASAAVGVVAVGVDVHTALGVGIVARDVVGDRGLGALGGLLEGHGALNIGVSAENGDCIVESASESEVCTQHCSRM